MATNSRLGARYLEPAGIPFFSPGPTGTIAHRQADDGDILSSPFNGGILVGEITSINKSAVNRVIKIRNIIYWLVGGSIYSFNETTDSFNGSWVKEIEFPAATTGSSNNIGLYPVYDQGANTQYLATAYQEGSTSTWRSIRKNLDTGIWESGNSSTVFQAGGLIQDGIFAEILFNNRVYFIHDDTNSDGIGVYDILSQSFSTVTWNEIVRHPFDFVVHSGLLYCLGKNDSAHSLVFRIEGGLAIRKLRLSSDANTSSNEFQGRNLLITDNEYPLDGGVHVDRMYAIYPTDGPGWGVSEIQATGTAPDLFEPRRIDGLLPTFIRTSLTPEVNIFRCLLDQANESINPVANTRQIQVLEFRGGGGDGQSLNHYSWSGPDLGGEMANLGSIAPQWHLASPHEKDGSGARFSTFAGSNKIMDIALSGLSDIGSGKLRLNFSLFPSLSIHAGTPVNVKWFFDTQGHSPQRQCTLQNSSHGTIGIDNVIKGIVMSSGVSYTTEWTWETDGVNKFDKVNLQGFVAITGYI